MTTATDSLLDNNAAYVSSFDKGDLPLPPARKLAVWAALRLPGAPVSVDGAVAPFGRSHRLVTSREPRCAPDGVCSRGEYHSSTVIDRVTPRSSPGVPAYGPVWRYMLTPRVK